VPSLSKPHRVGFLAPIVTVEGMEAPYAREGALLLWTACIEVCQRHPGLAVYDAESTPLLPLDGHFAPEHATLGATPCDAFWASTRRDELAWLELALPKPGPVRLHTLARDGTRETFDATGRTVGDQINQVLGAWLAARGLGALPRRFDAVAGDEVLAVVRVIGPQLSEHARKAPPAPAAEVSLVHAEGDAAPPEDLPSRPSLPALPRIARPTANRLPAPLRVAALRVLELAMQEDLGDLILALDPDHPRARFLQFLGGKPAGRDYALLRRVIATAPGWARPYAELVPEGDGDAPPHAPSELETVAGAGLAALCRPGQLDVVETAADQLREDGRIDEALRLMDRAARLHDRESRAHISLLHLHRSADRVGASLAQALRSGRVHGCPLDRALPWYPDQIQIDLLVADALLHAGRLDEAIALRANRLEGREAVWPRHAKILAGWRTDPRHVAWCYAREGYFRGDRARTIEGFGRAEPHDSVDVALLLDSLVAMGREDEVPLAWAQYGIGVGHTAPVARLAAARCLMVAGEWRRGLEELWRVELAAPVRDEQVAIARIGMLASAMPLEVAEAALAERVASGAHTLARRMARDIADFLPNVARSSIVMRALGLHGKTTPLEFDPVTIATMPIEPRNRRAIDDVFHELRVEGDPLARSDRLVNRWLEVVFAAASEDDPTALVQTAAYVAAQALGRYLASTTAPPTPLSGGLRTVAAEALALVHRYRDSLGDREARALLGVFEPLLRRVDRWVGTSWLATAERSCAIDERASGDVAGFAREYATVAARILGPEETAVLSASIARLHRERADGWESATGAQASRLAFHTGFAGVDEWADAVVAQLASRANDTDDAIDALLTASYLAEGTSAVPCVHAARVLFDVGRVPAALGVLSAGLGVATPEWRERALATLGDAWKRANPGVPLAFDQVATGTAVALNKGEPARAEKLGRWAVALDPSSADAHRSLGLALAQQGKTIDALDHLVRGARDQAPQLLAGVLHQGGKVAEAMVVLEYASRWYARADQWLAYGGVAIAAGDPARAAKAYGFAYQLDPAAFDAEQLHLFAGMLDETGDHAACERVAGQLLATAGVDLMWQTTAWDHLASAYIGLGRFDEAVELAGKAVELNPLPDHAETFAATLERAKRRTKSIPHLPPKQQEKAREPVFALLEAGDFTAAAAMIDDASWRVRRVALGAVRFRSASENDVDVTPRARAASCAILADTIGTLDREAVLSRMLALEIREQAYFARDPVPRLGERMTRDAFHRELRARGGVVLGDPEPPPPGFADRVVVPGSKVARASDYIALIRDLAALAPAEALAQFDLDEAGYLEVARAWGAAFEADPALAKLVSAGLAKR
jgi:tetratricopeptide (TPR) repeat protein